MKAGELVLRAFTLRPSKGHFYYILMDFYIGLSANFKRSSRRSTQPSGHSVNQPSEISTCAFQPTKEQATVKSYLFKVSYSPFIPVKFAFSIQMKLYQKQC